MLAKLHLASQGFNAPRRKTQPLVASFTIFASGDPRAAMDCYLSARLALAEDSVTRAACDEALTLLAPFHAELKPLLPGLEPLWTHNDLHASNLLWSDASDEARATAIIDFGLADRTNAVHDLAQAIERNIVEWLALRKGFEDTEDVPVHLDHLEALLDGYEFVRPLSNEEAAALAPMAAVCHAEFALTEADYFLGVVHSKENGRICTEGYLVGHARWFRGADGEKLLDAIRQWAATRHRQGAALAGARD
jgi:Ser/Thr protein kinase RdoA (MazF antagonist)